MKKAELCILGISIAKKYRQKNWEPLNSNNANEGLVDIYRHTEEAIL